VKLTDLPFETVEWSRVASSEHPGVIGQALWRTRMLGALRVRMVEYTPGYQADHWCQKGHAVLCLEGRLTTELADGRSFVLTPGMSYLAAEPGHRSSTDVGARLFIVD